MELADEAFFAKRRGNLDQAKKLIYEAFKEERTAAEHLRDYYSSEPSRSILYRSAASLALECGENREAEKLVALGLSGDPPPEIANELRHLFDEINFQKHLELNQISLSENEMQVSIAGNSVGYGITLSEIFIKKISDIEKLIIRTIERLSHHQFRERGPVKKEVAQTGVYIAGAVRAGSVAVTLRIGQQLGLPGIGGIASQAIDEVIDCIKLLDQGETESIRERIPEQNYYNNFVGLAKQIAPDGYKITTVGLTRTNHTGSRKVALRKIQKNIQLEYPEINLQKTLNQKGIPVTVKGNLLFANALHKGETTIKLRAAKENYTIIVPPGMMDDIVKPLWHREVSVSGLRYDKSISLQEIFPIDDQ